MNDIRNALNAGNEVITHTDAVSVPGWTGAGYIITDPLTGDGAYLISGGGNGAWFIGFIQGTSLALVLLMATFLSTVAAGAIWVLWLAIFLIVIANVLIVLDNLERYRNDEEWRSCYLGGFMAGIGLTGFGAIATLIGRLITAITTIMAFTVNTTYYGGCND